MNVGKDTQSPKRILPNDYLFLSGITKSIDEGTYTCVATSPPGGVLDEDGNPAKAEASIQLTVVRKSLTNLNIIRCLRFSLYRKKMLLLV